MLVMKVRGLFFIGRDKFKKLLNRIETQYVV